MHNLNLLNKKMKTRKFTFYFCHKVDFLEAKINAGKKKRVEFIEKAKEHEQMIQGLKSAFGDSLSYLGKGGAPSPRGPVTPRLSKSLPLATPSHTPSSLSADKYSCFHAPSANKPYSGSSHYSSDYN